MTVSVVPGWRDTGYYFINNISLQESHQPAYVALLAVQTTHRAVLAGDTQLTPVLCDRASEYLDEAVR